MKCIFYLIGSFLLQISERVYHPTAPLGALTRDPVRVGVALSGGSPILDHRRLNTVGVDVTPRTPYAVSTPRAPPTIVPLGEQRASE